MAKVKVAAETVGTPVSEYQARRARVLKELSANGGQVGLVLAGDGAPPLAGFWQPSSHFAYLTGIKDEQGAAVLFDPGHEDPKKRCVLFLKPLNPELEAWDGYREEISQALKDKTGFETVMRTMALPRMLTAALRVRKKAACLHAFAVYDGPVSPDLAVFRKVSERVPGVSIVDQTDLLNGLRAVKSRHEVGLVEKALAATAKGYEAITRTLRPGVTEKAVQRAAEAAFIEGGGSGPAYNSIVGSGKNATVLHYMMNTAVCRAGQLLVVDAGAAFEGYCADITRTYPVSGKFTSEQREMYELVLEAQEAAIAAVKPGRYMHEVDGAARKVFEKARGGGVADRFIHGIGHQLGMEVHDVTPDGALREGMIITIEPGLYFPGKSMGIRIEDDILVISSGGKNLSKMIPKSVKDVEAALR
jgi:Xaa-Pro aminopeptidase